MSENRNHEMQHIMSRILKIRYLDLEEEKRLCQELLAWAEESEDSFGKAFALTYLGDYYVAVYDEKNAGICLLEAQSMLQEDSQWDQLRLRVYCLLGTYFDIRMDEQSSIECYLKAIMVAEGLKDKDGECVALNNLAFAFQRHGSYELALTYYLKAYHLQKELEYGSIIFNIIGNLAEICLLTNQLEDAKSYIEECDQLMDDSSINKTLSDKNWCGYFAAVGEKEKALQCAERLLQNQDLLNEERLTAFETYHTLFRNMMDLKEAAYARRFLQAMEEISDGGGLDQSLALEKARMSYVLLFEPVETHAQVYRRFYDKNQEFTAEINQMIANAMKEKIILDDLTRRTQIMQSEQKVLEKEVNRDELTGIYNRKYFELLMRENDDSPEKDNLGIIILDVDYFKEYNDYYGHVSGDIILKEIADCLMTCRQEKIHPCRYGGDEFVCICFGLSEEEMVDYIKSVRNHLHCKALPHEKSHCSNEVTLSIGYTLGDKKAQMEKYLLFQFADQALYQSKHSGRNTYVGKRAELT